MNDPKKSWYVIYTRSNHEKKVCFFLDQKGIQSYLPMIEEIRTWSDRKKRVRVPMFPNYVFVHLGANQLWIVRDLPGAVRLVGIGKKPSSVPGSVIESLKKVEKGNIRIDDLNLYKGEKVRIMSGEFIDVEGEFIRKGTKNLLTIGIEIMNRVVVLELDSSQVQRLQRVNVSVSSS